MYKIIAACIFSGSMIGIGILNLNQSVVNEQYNRRLKQCQFLQERAIMNRHQLLDIIHDPVCSQQLLAIYFDQNKSDILVKVISND